MSTIEDKIQAALVDCRLEEDPNFSEIARKHSVDRSTLSRRFKGIQQSYFESRSESIQCLNSQVFPFSLGCA
jgi:transposase-like protein